MTKYDAGIIGAGPGGYVAAIRMSQLGLKVALAEQDAVGGVCLHRGCVPTKALYSATRLITQTDRARRIGLAYSSPKIDIEKLVSWKSRIVTKMTKGIESLLKANKIDVFNAQGTLTAAGQISLSNGEQIEAERVVLATGSKPIEIPGIEFDNPAVWSSKDALSVPEVPDRLLIIGGGVIGLELATVYNRLGSTVTVVEMMDSILPGISLDRRAVAQLSRGLKKASIKVQTGMAIQSIDNTASDIIAHTRDGSEMSADKIISAVGRRPYTTDLDLDTLGIETDSHGFVRVDKNLQTTVSSVYAIGDLTPGPMLAHKASAEAVKLAAHFAGEEMVIDYKTIPQAIFTDPEVALVGYSEKQAKEEGKATSVGRFPYAALGKAQGMNEIEGFFQVVADQDTGSILGVQIVGAEASDIISEAALAIQQGISAERLADTIHPHPTLPEGLKEAAENALGKAIHTA